MQWDQGPKVNSGYCNTAVAEEVAGGLCQRPSVRSPFREPTPVLNSAISVRSSGGTFSLVQFR